MHIALSIFIADQAMLKISTVDTRSERRLIVEGKLIQPWLAELTKIWLIANENLEGRKLVIDLSNATTISQEGENALFELMRAGAGFSYGGVLTRHVLKRLASRCQRGAGNCKRSNE